MEKERILYDAFVDTLLLKVNSGDITPKELEIVMNFLKNNNIQASSKHQGLSKLAEQATSLPFEDEELLPERTLKRIK
jgi:hypothetical protein